MSLYNPQSRFLSTRPTIRIDSDRLTISTSIFFKILTLGCYGKEVIIDKIRKEVTINKRIFWLITNTQILALDELKYIDYSYKSLNTSYGVMGAKDKIETFIISFIGKRRQKYPICKFRGEGAVNTGVSGMLLGGDKLFDYSGTQANESRNLVDIIKEYTGLSLGEPLSETQKSMLSKCPHCGQMSSNLKTDCLYCGRPLNK